MFDSNPLSQRSDSDLDLSSAEPSRIESILLHSCLPEYVRTAAISHVCERLIDAMEISRLTDASKLEKDDAAILERLEIRKKALSAHTGATLTCVLIHLPGTIYTIEIDRTTDSIIHWEWQRS